LPPGVLGDSLVTIGVPRAKRIITDEVVKEEKVEESTPTPESESVLEPDTIIELKEDDEEDEQDSPLLLTTEKSLKVKAGEVTVIDDQDLPDIEDALTAVESLSDSFMAPTPETPVNETSLAKPQIRISLVGSSEVKASISSTATDPNLIVTSRDSEEIESVSQSSTSIQTNETPEEIVIQGPDIQHEEEVDTEIRVPEPTEEISGSVTLEEATKPKDKITPSHAVRPLVSAKIVILGEDGVGKHSLQEKAGLRIQDGPEIDGDPKKFIRSAIFRLEDYRVDVNVWSFDDAVKMKISRRDFYRDTNAIIIVFSVADRWSFESIDFWLKESTVKAVKPPPIIIVGNKKDIRDAGEPDPLEPPVSSEEGFKLAESLAKKMGEGGKLHPIAFIETSCLTGEGTEDVFRTAGQFYTNTL